MTPETIISFCCRLKLSEDLKVPMEDLKYIGDMEVPGGKLVMFNILTEGLLEYSTRSIKIKDE